MEKSRELTTNLFEELKELKNSDEYIIVETSGTHPSRVMKLITNNLIDKLVIVVKKEEVDNSCVLKSALLVANNNKIDFELKFRLNNTEENITKIKYYKNFIDDKLITIE